MTKSKKSNTIDLPDGTTRYLIERTFEASRNSFTGPLGEVAAYWQKLATEHPTDAVVSDNTPYEQAEIYIQYSSPETDEEYAVRMEDEARRARLIQEEKDRARDKAIQRRARSPRKLTQKQELQLLADLKAKYPDADS